MKNKLTKFKFNLKTIFITAFLISLGPLEVLSEEFNCSDIEKYYGDKNWYIQNKVIPTKEGQLISKNWYLSWKNNGDFQKCSKYDYYVKCGDKKFTVTRYGDWGHEIISKSGVRYATNDLPGASPVRTSCRIKEDNKLETFSYQDYPYEIDNTNIRFTLRQSTTTEYPIINVQF